MKNYLQLITAAKDGVEIPREDELIIEDIYLEKSWIKNPPKWGATGLEKKAIEYGFWIKEDGDTLSSSSSDEEHESFAFSKRSSSSLPPTSSGFSFNDCINDSSSSPGVFSAMIDKPSTPSSEDEKTAGQDEHHENTVYFTRLLGPKAQEETIPASEDVAQPDETAVWVARNEVAE